MNDIYSFVLLNIHMFLFILVRTTGIFVIAPVLSRNNIPMIMKIGLSLLVTYILLPVVTTGIEIQYNNILELFFIIINEFLIGITIGFIGFIYFSTLYLAGTIIDTEIGFGMVNVLDPQMRTQVPIMGNFYTIIVTLLFLIADGHHFIIETLVYSYNLLPIGFKFTVGDGMVYKLTTIMAEIFILAFKFSAPILITIFIANLVLGILAKTMPQMNIFIVGMPLKILIGLLTILITLQYMVPFSETLFDKMYTATYEIIEILSKG